LGKRRENLFKSEEEFEKDLNSFFEVTKEGRIATWFNHHKTQEKKVKNNWEELKKLLREVSEDTNLSGGQKYERISISELILFILLFRVKTRVVI
jgi:hypothetical protein